MGGESLFALPGYEMNEFINGFINAIKRLFCRHKYDLNTMRHWGGYFKNKRLLAKDGSEHDIRRYSEMLCVKCKRYVRL